MKSKFLKKLCVYAISASMVLPASAPVLAATTTSVVRDYSFNLLEMNYTNAVLYEGDSLQLRTTHPASKINKLPGRLTWISRACLKIKNCTKHLFLSPFYSIIKKKGCSLC